MLNFLRALAVLAVVLMGPSMAGAQGANGTTLSWKVTGTISEMPGQPAAVPFSCTVTAAAPSCSLPTGSIAIDFLGIDGDSFAARFKPARPCGGGELCTALFADDNTVNDQVDSVNCSSLVITAASETRAYFPCATCFGGLKPSFLLNWRASAACVTTTTSTSTSSTTSTT